MEKGKEVVYLELLSSKSMDEQLLESPEIKKTTCTYAGNDCCKFEISKRIECYPENRYGVIVYVCIAPKNKNVWLIFEDLPTCNICLEGFRSFFELKRLYREFQHHFTINDIQSIVNTIKPICEKIKEGKNLCQKLKD